MPMGLMKRSIPAGYCLLFCCLLTPLPAPAESQWNLGLGIDFATGDYGTDTTTDSLRVPLSIGYAPTRRLDLELVIPYLYQSSSTTTLSGGVRFPTDRQGGRRRTTDTEPPEEGITTTEESESRDGLGDLTLTAGYVLLPEGDRLPALRPLLYLKFPTADEDEGLGTGEFDIGAGVGAVKWFGRWYTFAEGRYIWQGSNAELGLEDYATLEGETGYRLSANFFPAVALWWSSPPANGSPDLADLRLKGIYSGETGVSIEGYLGTGLSEASADLLAGLSLFYRF